MKKLPKPQGVLMVRTRKDIHSIPVKDYTGLRYVNEVRKLNS